MDDVEERERLESSGNLIKHDVQIGESKTKLKEDFLRLRILNSNLN